MNQELRKYIKGQKGFSVLEVILAAGIFVVFSSATVSVVLQGFDANRTGSEETIANQYASEGMEAIRSIKNQNFNNLVATTSVGFVRNGTVWAFGGLNNIFGKYTRVAGIAVVQRDASGNIVASGGTVDPNIVKATVTVSWNVSPTRNNSVVLTSYFSNWKSGRNGMLVYGDGGTTADAVTYQTFDGGTNTWSTPATAFDVDPGSTNRALRAVKVYASGTRNEKIVISRHYRTTGTIQAIYATVWNGSSWGTPTQLAAWTASTFLDVQNFDGTYLSNGNFMVVYSDNTIIPKYSIWDGTSWTAQGSLTTLGASQIPTFIVTQARPGTNEVMAAFSTQGASGATGNTITEYWSSTAWSTIVTHATASGTNTKRLVDFQWSPGTPTIGALVFTGNGGTVTKIATRIFVADGGGGGSWGTAVSSTTTQAGNVGPVDIEPRSTAPEFQTCDKDSLTTIYCYKMTFSGNVATIGTAATLTTTTFTGQQKAYAIGFESIGDDILLSVFSDNTTVPKFKKYTASTSTWDAATASVTTTGSPGVLNTVRVIPQGQADDMLVLMGDANLDFYSIFWDGTGNAFFTTPAAKAFTTHGTNGSAVTDLWYDFAWDKF